MSTDQFNTTFNTSAVFETVYASESTFIIDLALVSVIFDITESRFQDNDVSPCQICICLTVTILNVFTGAQILSAIFEQICPVLPPRVHSNKWTGAVMAQHESPWSHSMKTDSFDISLTVPLSLRLSPTLRYFPTSPIYPHLTQQPSKRNYTTSPDLLLISYTSMMMSSLGKPYSRTTSIRPALDTR